MVTITVTVSDSLLSSAVYGICNYGEGLYGDEPTGTVVVSDAPAVTVTVSDSLV